MFRRRYARRGSKRRRFSVYRRGSTRKQVRRVARQVKRLNSAIETKHVDTAFDWTNVALSPSYLYLSNISEGSGESNRIGRKIKATSIYVNLRATVDYTSISVDQTATIRFILFIDKEFNGTIATPQDVFQFTTGGVVGPMTFVSPLLWKNRRRFKILRDWLWHWDNYDTPSDASSSSTFIPPANWTKQKRFKVKLGHSIYYQGSADTYTSGKEGSVFLMAFSDSASIPHPVYSAAFRLCYRDL